MNVTRVPAGTVSSRGLTPAAVMVIVVPPVPPPPPPAAAAVRWGGRADSPPQASGERCQQ